MEHGRILGNLPTDPDSLGLVEIVRAELYRSRPDGGYLEPRDLVVEDLIVDTGRVWLAKRIAQDIGSAMFYMAVGTVATAPALGNTTLTGEVKRKALSTNTGDATHIYTGVATYGGAADSVSSLIIQEAGLFNHASSGQGTMFQRVTFASVTLADSDMLKLTLMTNVGSS